MNKLDKNKQIERPKVEPLGDIRIAEARGKNPFTCICLSMKKLNTYFECRILGVNEKRYLRGNYKDQIQH